MEHTIPTTPLGVLQAILRELILARDSEATFHDKEVEPDPEPKPLILGGSLPVY